MEERGVTGVTAEKDHSIPWQRAAAGVAVAAAGVVRYGPVWRPSSKRRSLGIGR